MKKNAKKRSWLWIIIFLALLSLSSLFIASILGVIISKGNIGTGNIAVIDINGVIMTGKDGIFSSSIASSTEIVKLIEKIEKDKSIKGMILMINSPGGSAVASQEIADAINELNMTTVAVIRDVGASGGYWVSSAADKIFASKLSIVGSIGVRASYLEFADMIQDYNVTYRRLVAGKYKDMGSPFKELTEEENKLFQEVLDQMHEVFIEEVSQNRNLDVEAVRALATGQFFTGIKAKEVGLIDEFGNKKHAKEYFEKELNMTVKLKEYKKPIGILDVLAESSSESFYRMGEGLGHGLKTEQGLQFRA